MIMLQNSLFIAKKMVEKGHVLTKKTSAHGFGLICHG